MVVYCEKIPDIELYGVIFCSPRVEIGSKYRCGIFGNEHFYENVANEMKKHHLKYTKAPRKDA